MCNGGQIVYILKRRFKKSLKISKRQSESVYRRRTDNTMAKRKSTKRTNNDQQNIHIKLNSNGQQKIHQYQQNELPPHTSNN
jgi:hypothetical protein